MSELPVRFELNIVINRTKFLHCITRFLYAPYTHEIVSNEGVANK
jgi:hypothetical protein